MEILGFNKVSDDLGAQARWKVELDRQVENGARLVTLTVINGFGNPDTGNFEYDGAEVRDLETGDRLGQYTPEEFRNLRYDEEGWFDANGPYHPPA